jgi:hypothetical protein
MPLNTQIIRNGKQLPLRWGDFHVAAMALAACFDEGSNEVLSDPTKIYEEAPEGYLDYPNKPFPITPSLAWTLTTYPMLSKTPLNEGHYTLKNKQVFIDMADNEVLELLPGDELIAFRDF